MKKNKKRAIKIIDDSLIIYLKKMKLLQQADEVSAKELISPQGAGNLPDVELGRRV